MEDTKKTSAAQGRAEAAKAKRTKKPEAIPGSEEAKRQAAVILEVMSGVRGAQEGAEVLGISSMRYYVLEERALQGMVTALEPRPKGRRERSPEDTLKLVEKEREKYKREAGRYQTLLRMVRKSVRLQDPKWGAAGAGAKASGPTGATVDRKKARKPARRVEKILERLRPAAEPAAAEASV